MYHTRTQMLPGEPPSICKYRQHQVQGHPVPPSMLTLGKGEPAVTKKWKDLYINPMVANMFRSAACNDEANRDKPESTINSVLFGNLRQCTHLCLAYGQPLGLLTS